MLARPVVAAVSDRRRRSEIDATIYVPPYSNSRAVIHFGGSIGSTNVNIGVITPKIMVARIRKW